MELPLYYIHSTTCLQDTRQVPARLSVRNRPMLTPSFNGLGPNRFLPDRGADRVLAGVNYTRIQTREWFFTDQGQVLNK
jgi:hypothetical protein